MPIPTEPIGSVPRTTQLLSAMADHATGRISDEQFQAAQKVALGETIAAFEATGSPVITDGEQTKPSFATYPLSGLSNLAPDGVVIPFADGHTRQLPRLASGPFRYGTHAVSFLKDRPAVRPSTVEASCNLGVGPELVVSSGGLAWIFTGSFYRRPGQ